MQWERVEPLLIHAGQRPSEKGGQGMKSVGSAVFFPLGRGKGKNCLPWYCRFSSSGGMINKQQLSQRDTPQQHTRAKTHFQINGPLLLFILPTTSFQSVYFVLP